MSIFNDIFNKLKEAFSKTEDVTSEGICEVVNIIESPPNELKIKLKDTKERIDEIK